MDTQRFEATVKVKSPGGATLLVKTQIFAQDYYRAKLLLEQQYGRGSVLGTPRKIA